MEELPGKQKQETATNLHMTGILTGLAGLYVAAAWSQFSLQPGLRMAPVVSWVVISTLLLLGARLVLLRIPISGRWMHLLGVAITCLILYNTLFHLYLLFGEGETALNWVLLGLGVASFLLSARQLLLVVSVTLCIWVVVASLAFPTESWLYFAFGLFTATGLKVYSEFQESNLQKALKSAATELKRRQKTERKLIFQASHDPLTQLPNRSVFLSRLEKCLAESRNTGIYRFAVLFLDLDRFKVVNDSLGHLVGDDLLQAVSSRLQDSLRPGDIVSRLGGDEFAILLEGIEGSLQAESVAARIQQRLARPFPLGNRQVFTSSAIGIAVGAASYQRPEELLRDADTALYRAKRSGPAALKVFDRHMRLEALQNMQIEQDVRAALANGELIFHFQPIFSLGTGKVVAAEALLRWNHPRRGLLDPDDFLTLAEENGLTVPIGFWGLREVCQKAGEWQLEFPERERLSVGFNLSGAQLTHPDLLGEVTAALEDSHLPAELLELEIRESILMQNFNSSRTVLEGLQEKGVRIVLDDFGTGYSSLRHLHRLSFDAAKVDRSFISPSRLEENYPIVKAMTDMIHGLGMLVVAEGVETAEQAATLKRLSCDLGQGHYFSQPLNGTDFQEFLAQNRPLTPLFMPTPKLSM